MARPNAPQSELLKKWLTSAISRQTDLKPLPTTREIGRKFSLSNSTAFRVLESFEREGKLWRAPSGRFYPSSARHSLEQILPMACMTRKIEHWSLVYQSLMEGVSAECAAREVPLVLWNDDLLVQHADTSRPPIFASLSQQRASLKKFLHRSSFSGLLLDHIWADAALKTFKEELPPSVLVYRETMLPWLPVVSLPFANGADQALTHLLERGFETILPVIPFSNDSGIDQMLTALRESATRLKIGTHLKPAVSAATSSVRKSLIARLKNHPGRIALLSPEDHITRLLHDGLLQTGIRVPKHIGLFSLQGTQMMTERNISTIHFDFRALGQCAAQILFGSSGKLPDLSPTLHIGETT